MRSTSTDNFYFDDNATHAMGAAFDKACSSLSQPATADTARELIARRIIEAAKTGQRDQARGPQVLEPSSTTDRRQPLA